jgi:hypothetical protein
MLWKHDSRHAQPKKAYSGELDELSRPGPSGCRHVDVEASVGEACEDGS